MANVLSCALYDLQRIVMDEADALLSEIAALIESDKNAQPLDISVIKFMGIEELTNIRDNLLKRKRQRRAEQEDWYNEWAGIKNNK
ncbi:MAG: hypothetical protein LBB59_04960 [Campylobacteraceae bacterium]|jgi:hypothetical protein|nr:hypothetical protein [Campylobacteraceae bacterium]